MKVLFNKLKKANKVLLIITFIIFIIYLIGYITLFKNLIGLSGIETIIRFIIIGIFGIWAIIYLIWSLTNLILKRNITIILTSFLTIAFVIVFSYSNHYINIIYNSIDNLAEEDYITYTTNLVTLNTTSIESDSILGLINSTDDIEGNILAKELIKKEKLTKNETKEYSSYYEMIDDLLKKKVDGIFLSSDYLTIFSEDEFKGISNTKIAYSYSQKMANQDKTIASNKSLTEPFTILLMGVDSTIDGLEANARFNGDTLMLITFNPKTLNATMFSIPRDTFVPITCNHNSYGKINSSAAYGTNCVIDTVEAFTGIDIDYYLKINFKGVVDLVEALDGIDVDVEAPNYSSYINEYKGKICEQNSLRQFGDQLICIEPGMQHLNGEEALAYARCRHAYLLSDIARNKHQQQIVEAIAKKAANKDNINKIEEILNAITKNLNTNMSKNTMLSFYEVLKNMLLNSLNDGEFVTIQKTYLEYYNLPVRLSSNGEMRSAIGHYPGSLEAIVKLMKVNLELEKEEPIKTFDFDAYEEFTTKPTGQGIRTGKILETMPNFIGKSIEEVETWCLNHNIVLNKEMVTNESEYYNVNINPGLIGNQSILDGYLLNGIEELTIYINSGSAPEGDDEDNDTPNNNEYDNNDFSNNQEDTDLNDDPLKDILP